MTAVFNKTMKNDKSETNKKLKTRPVSDIFRATPGALPSSLAGGRHPSTTPYTVFFFYIRLGLLVAGIIG